METVGTKKVDERGRVTLPADFAGHLVIVERAGPDEVRVRKAGVVPRRRTLDELLAGITPENIHPETDFGSPVGKEVL